MDAETVQRTRYLLRSRFRRAQECPDALFIPAVRQLYRWLQMHPLFGSMVCAPATGWSDAAAAVFTHRDVAVSNSEAKPADRKKCALDYSATTVEEHAQVCLAVVTCLSSEYRTTEAVMSAESKLAHLLTRRTTTKRSEAIEQLRDVALDGLYEHLDESLDSRNVLSSLIRKYKERGEWFQRARLRALADAGGERALARDLYEYLHDQGVDFTVEETTSSGEPDVVLRDSSGGRIVADAKHIKASATRAEVAKKLRDGFHQVQRYCNDLHEPAGHLVVYSDREEWIQPELEVADGWQYLKLGFVVVYFTEIRIGDLPSASKGGQSKVLAIGRDRLVHDADGEESMS